jgi:hypothetical protein
VPGRIKIFVWRLGSRHVDIDKENSFTKSSERKSSVLRMREGTDDRAFE